MNDPRPLTVGSTVTWDGLVWEVTMIDEAGYAQLRRLEQAADTVPDAEPVGAESRAVAVDQIGWDADRATLYVVL